MMATILHSLIMQDVTIICISCLVDNILDARRLILAHDSFISYRSKIEGSHAAYIHYKDDTAKENEHIVVLGKGSLDILNLSSIDANNAILELS